jgi:quercetin dioxygenase-like cupin family protein
MNKLILISTAALAAAAPAQAKTHHSSLKWAAAPPSLPSGAQMAVVSGNPGAKGKFVIQLKFPADYAVPPHSHPTTELLRMVSGNLHYGTTDKLDMSQAKTLHSGQTFLMKANMHHWVHAAAPAVLQVSGRGPFVITYVDPKDDPRTK